MNTQTKPAQTEKDISDRQLRAVIALEDCYIDTRGCSRETARGYALDAIRARLMVPEHNHEAAKAIAERDALQQTEKSLDLAMSEHQAAFAEGKLARLQDRHVNPYQNSGFRFAWHQGYAQSDTDIGNAPSVEKLIAERDALQRELDSVRKVSTHERMELQRKLDEYKAALKEERIVCKRWRERRDHLAKGLEAAQAEHLEAVKNYLLANKRNAELLAAAKRVERDWNITRRKHLASSMAHLRSAIANTAAQA